MKARFLELAQSCFATSFKLAEGFLGRAAYNCLLALSTAGFLADEENDRWVKRDVPRVMANVVVPDRKRVVVRTVN